MSQDGEQAPPALIHPDDTGALEKYIRLMDLSAPTRTTNGLRDDASAGLDELVRLGGFKVDSKAQECLAEFVRGLVEALCGFEDIYITDINGVADAEGNLIEDHPLVPQLGVSLPRWSPVLVFQLLDEEMVVDSTVAEEKEGERTTDTGGAG